MMVSFSPPLDLSRAVCLAGLVGVAAFRRDRIVRPAMFRASYLLFALSLILPAVDAAYGQYLQAYAHWANTQTVGRLVNPNIHEMSYLRITLDLAEVIVFAASVVCLLASLVVHPATASTAGSASAASASGS